MFQEETPVIQDKPSHNSQTEISQTKRIEPTSEFSYGKFHRPRSNVTREIILEHNFQETEHVTVSTDTLILIQKQLQMITAHLIYMNPIVSEL